MSANDPGLTRAVAGSGLIEPGSTGVALVSGGPDSACLVAGLAALDPPPDFVALHVDYRLRAESDEDQRAAAGLCERFGIELITIRAGKPEGNVQAWARELRYAEAEAIRRERNLDWIATGHTETDVAETVIYRLAASPGRRALAAMRPRSGTVVRPLLTLRREETRAAAIAAGLPFVDDRTNLNPAFARARIRSEILPVLTEINAGAIGNISLTRAELVEEGELLDELAAELLETATGPGGALIVAGLEDAHPALRRLAIRRFAENELGEPVPVSIAQAATLMRLAAGPEGGSVDLGSGRRLTVESGRLLAVAAGGEEAPPAPAAVIAIPGETRWGDWLITVEDLEPPFEPGAPGTAAIDLDATGPRLVVRAWRSGDRIQPLGMAGSKKLQDLFTDTGVPRSERRGTPVIVAGDHIVWVAGLALAHPFRLRPGTRSAALISAARG